MRRGGSWGSAARPFVWMMLVYRVAGSRAIRPYYTKVHNFQINEHTRERGR